MLISHRPRGRFDRGQNCQPKNRPGAANTPPNRFSTGIHSSSGRTNCGARRKSRALGQRFPDQFKIAVFQIAQPAVDQPGRATGGAGGDIVRIDDPNAHTVERQLAGQCAAVDAGSQNQYGLIERVHVAALIACAGATDDESSRRAATYSWLLSVRCK